MDTRRASVTPDVTAPDGSEIRLLGALRGGSAVHCTLPAGAVSRAVRHRTVEEVWYILGGRGQVWRKLGDRELTVDVEAGVCLTIPLGAHFQFRADGAEALEIFIVTMPPWPGPDEAIRVPDHWPVDD